MELITIRDYAESRHITYEAVCKQVRQYKGKDLKGHLTYQGKLTFLDETAVDFLDKHRMKRNIVLAPTDKEIKNDIARLQEELKQVMIERDQLKNKVIAMQEEQIKYIEDKAKNETLLKLADAEHEELERTRQQLEESRATNHVLQEENTRHQQELNKYKPSLFGFYRKTE